MSKGEVRATIPAFHPVWADVDTALGKQDAHGSFRRCPTSPPTSPPARRSWTSNRSPNTPCAGSTAISAACNGRRRPPRRHCPHRQRRPPRVDSRRTCRTRTRPGRLSIDPSAPAALAHDLLHALGKRLPAGGERYGSRADSQRPALGAVATWILTADLLLPLLQDPRASICPAGPQLHSCPACGGEFTASPAFGRSTVRRPVAARRRSNVIVSATRNVPVGSVRCRRHPHCLTFHHRPDPHHVQASDRPSRRATLRSRPPSRTVRTVSSRSTSWLALLATPEAARPAVPTGPAVIPLRRTP